MKRRGMKVLGASLGLMLVACQGESHQGGSQPATLAEVNQSLDWQHTPGADLNASFNQSVKRILMAMSRADAIAAVEAAGYGAPMARRMKTTLNPPPCACAALRHGPARWTGRSR